MQTEFDFLHYRQTTSPCWESNRKKSPKQLWGFSYTIAVQRGRYVHSMGKFFSKWPRFRCTLSRHCEWYADVSNLNKGRHKQGITTHNRNNGPLILGFPIGTPVTFLARAHPSSRSPLQELGGGGGGGGGKETHYLVPCTVIIAPALSAPLRVSPPPRHCNRD